jgi:hypothetical protein
MFVNMTQLFRVRLATSLNNRSMYCFLLRVGLSASLGACDNANEGGTPLCAGYYVDETESAPGKSMLYRGASGVERVIVEGDLLEVQGNCLYIFATQRGDGQEVLYTVVNIRENRGGFYLEPVSKQHYTTLIKDQVMSYHFTF